MIPLATALLLGVRHAFEADHLAAVGAFAATRPGPRAALGFGLRWAAGHGAIVVVAGGALALLSVDVPTGVDLWFERAVGASLVALGAWTIASGCTLHAHRHSHPDGTTHEHLHSHLHDEGHEHGHAVTALGVLHGLAGTAPVVALIPVVEFDSAAVGVAFLLAFAVGTAMAMAAYGLLAGWIAGGAAARSAAWARRVAVASGIVTAAIGVYWIVGA